MKSAINHHSYTLSLIDDILEYKNNIYGQFEFQTPDNKQHLIHFILKNPDLLKSFETSGDFWTVFTCADSGEIYHYIDKLLDIEIKHETLLTSDFSKFVVEKDQKIILLSLDESYKNNLIEIKGDFL